MTRAILRTTTAKDENDDCRSRWPVLTRSSPSSRLQKNKTKQTWRAGNSWRLSLVDAHLPILVWCRASARQSSSSNAASRVRSRPHRAPSTTASGRRSANLGGRRTRVWQVESSRLCGAEIRRTDKQWRARARAMATTTTTTATMTAAAESQERPSSVQLLTRVRVVVVVDERHTSKSTRHASAQTPV